MAAKDDERAWEQHGLTNDESRVVAVRNWVQAAVADGWDGPEAVLGDPVQVSCLIQRQGFRVRMVAREHTSLKYRYTVRLSGWGPDGLTVRLPDRYDWAGVRAAVRTCNLCGETDIDPKRYSFAGRCCEACLPKAQREHEYPGWTN